MNPKGLSEAKRP